MRRAAWTLVMAVGLTHLPLPARGGDPPAAQKAPPPLPRNDAKLQTRVNKAIDRGVAWLRTRQRLDGSFEGSSTYCTSNDDRSEHGVRNDIWSGSELGEAALALYALRACGVREDDPVVVRGFEWLRKTYMDLRSRHGLRTYAVSLILLALEAHRNPPQAPGPDADRYGRSARTPPSIPPEDLEWMKELTAWLVKAQTGEGGFGYFSPAHSWHDHSNTQFSLLALKAARRCGIQVPRKVWLKALKHLLDVQEEDGPAVPRQEEADGGGGVYSPVVRTVARDRARGWGYGDLVLDSVKRPPSTGSMTTGGVSSLALCRSELLGGEGYDRGLDARAVGGIRDGLAWLGLHFTVTRNPVNDDHWQYYYLYGLERAGVLAGVKWISTHDWYLEGAFYLVEEQCFDGPSGSWAGRGDNSIPAWASQRDGTMFGSNFCDTCFAVLFLKRATQRLVGGTATAGPEEEFNISGAPTLDARAFRDLFDAVFRRFSAADPVGRKERVLDFVRMGTRSIPLLVLRLDSADVGERAAALDALRMTTGETQGFAPSAPQETRSSTLRAWEEWWFSRKSRLVADVAAGRFREE